MALTISQMAAASYPAVLKNKPANQWYENAFLDALQAKGMVKSKSFGPTLELPIDYQANPTVQFLSVGNQALSLTETEVLGTASYSFGQLSETVQWTKETEVANPSENQKISIVEGLLSNALKSHDDLIEQKLFSTTTNGFLGLQTVIPDSGQGTVGGINAGTEVFWRNHTDTFYDDASDFEAQVSEAFGRVMKGSGGSSPDMIISGLDAYNLYLSTQQSNQRWVNTTSANAGFTSFKVQNADWVWSQYGGTRVYVLPKQALMLFTSKEYFRDKTETVELQNANMFSFKIYSALQLVTDNKSRLAVLTQTAA